MAKPGRTKPGTTKPRAARKPAPKPVAAPAPAAEPAPEPDEPAIVLRLDAPSKWSGALVAGGLMLMAGVSFFAIRGLRRRK